MADRPSLRIAGFLGGVYVSAGVATAFLPLFLADRGLSAAAIGQVLGLTVLARLVTMPVWGWLQDRAGPRGNLLFWATAGASLASLAYLQASGFVPILLVAMAQVAASSALMPLGDVLCLALAAEGRIDYGRVRATGSAAFMAATAVAGPMVGAFGARVVPLLMAAGTGFAAAVAPLLPKITAPARRTHTGGSVRLLGNRAFLLTLGASTCIQGAHSAYYALGSLHWRNHGISDLAIGLLWAEGVLAETLLFVWAGRIGARLGPAGLTACAALAALLRWSITAWTTDLAVLAVVQALHGATYGMQHLSAMLMLSRAVPSARAATAQTLHATLGNAIPGGLLIWASGALYDGSGRVFLLMAGIGACGLAFVPGLARASRNMRAA